MILNILAILAGFVLLTWSADRFVFGASGIARTLGISPLVVGLTIVGLGTSAPEMLVSGLAAYEGSPALGIGNAVGSNITNIALVLGVSALVAPMTVRSGILKREFPLLLGVMVLSTLLILDGYLGTVDGVILMTGLVVVMGWLVSQGRKHHEDDPMSAEYAQEVPEKMPVSKALVPLFVGLLVLLGSSKLLVWGATNVALAFGVSELIIGLTIVAIGTSLPELAASVMSALKNEHDIALGNIIGSNIFNLLAVFSLPGLIYPAPLDPSVLIRDFPIMFLLTIALLPIAFDFKGNGGRINRVEGGFLLAAFIGYQVLLYFSVTAG